MYIRSSASEGGSMVSREAASSERKRGRRKVDRGEQLHRRHRNETENNAIVGSSESDWSSSLYHHHQDRVAGVV